MNHAFVTTKHKPIDPEVIEQTLRRVSEEMFGGLLEVMGDVESGWGVALGDHGMAVWLETSRRIELRRHRAGDLTGWVQNVVQCELGKAVGGMLGDEGIQERWAPDAYQTPTFRSYYDMVHDHLPALMRRLFWKAALGGLPDDVRAMVEGQG